MDFFPDAELQVLLGQRCYTPLIQFCAAAIFVMSCQGLDTETHHLELRCCCLWGKELGLATGSFH